MASVVLEYFTWPILWDCRLLGHNAEANKTPPKVIWEKLVALA